MARIRTIKPDFWTDEKVVELSFPARLLFIGLWNFVDDEGRIQFSPKKLKMLIFPADSVEISELLGEIRRENLITIYEVDGVQYLQVSNFNKHQKVDKRSPSKLPAPDGTFSNPADSPRVPPTEGKVREVEGNNNLTTPNAHESDLLPLPEVSESTADWVKFFQRMGYPLFEIKSAKLMTHIQSWHDRRVPFRVAQIGVDDGNEKNGRQGDKPVYYISFIETAITAQQRLTEGLSRKENSNGQHGTRRYSPNEAVRIARERRASAGLTIDVGSTELDG